MIIFKFVLTRIVYMYVYYLRRCGRIVTLSFSSYQDDTLEDGSLMGWLIGNLPPSIRLYLYHISMFIFYVYLYICMYKLSL
jgi:hypothetical protein